MRNNTYFNQYNIMYKVLLISGDGEKDRWILRQTHNHEGISRCGKYKFYVNEMIPDPDFVVVRGKSLKKDTVFNVAPENVVLSTSEPYSVLAYPADYCRQFGMVCSCQENLKHKNVVFTPAMIFWFVGALFGKGGVKSSIDYDEFKAMPLPEKSKLVSVVTSNKAFTQGHQDRIDFVEKLKAYYGDRLDVFGRGYCGFDDKWSVLAPYKYHIAIENSESKYYWTEKLSDCYLAGCYPIYYGCTNVNDYFSEKSYCKIDIHDFEGAVKIIDRLIAEDAYSKSVDALRESKELVLEDYNMFNYIASCLDRLDPDAPKSSVLIKPAKSMHDLHNIYLYVVERNLFKIKKLIKSLFKGKSILSK